ncbi:MAG: HAD family hydrolase [Clostridia bacterium]|nr:HAD family hydrolase [Clostridia bacterium]MBQ9856353.1 HAD family hydrolase [Clostridia bacterium]
MKKLNEITDVLPEEFIMIGDSPTSDIMGAGNAGMKTIYFDRHKKGLGGNIRADYTVHALEEIFSIL